MTGPGGIERTTLEVERVNSQDPIRVYPLGFTPDLKKRLIEAPEVRQLAVARGMTEIKGAILGALDKFQEGKLDAQELFDIVNTIDQHERATGEATREEVEALEHLLRTEEELAVIFAKVSRNPGSFEEIARSVTEDTAGKFHGRYVLDYGHASVAEHAVLKQAVENVPSLDGDVITDSRVGVIITEFSARFGGPQGVGYYEPESVKRDPRLSSMWNKAHRFVFATHNELLKRGVAYIQTEEGRVKHPERRAVDRNGKPVTKTVADQIKGMMPGSRLTSMGVTINAREAAHLVRKMLSSPYLSVQKLGEAMKRESEKVTPTLFKYADRNEHLVSAREGLGQVVERRRDLGEMGEMNEDKKLVELIEFDPRADAKFLAAALFQSNKTGSLKHLIEVAQNMSPAEKERELFILMGKMSQHDAPIRALEMPGDYLVEYPGMTYDMWREYRRHRLQWMSAKDPDVCWGSMVPKLLIEMDQSKDSQFHGSVEAFKRAMEALEILFAEVSKVDQYAAHYAVARLHYKPAAAKFNIREAFHLLYLRTGPTAHPSIRRLMWPLFDQLKEATPLLMKHLQLKMDLVADKRPDRSFEWTY